MKSPIHIVLFFLCLSANALAQQHLQPFSPIEPEKGILYDKETSFDFRVHTNGLFALGYNIGKIRTYYKTRFIHFGIGELKHPKENRYNINRNFLNGPPSSSFIYGKQNAFFALRVGMGQKRYFSERARKKGVRVGISYEAGPVIGLLKPYYIDIFTNETGNRPVIITVRYSEETRSDFLSPWKILGASGLFKGASEMRFIPGLQIQTALHLEWGSQDELLRALEMGIMLDAFPKKIPILIPVENDPNRPFFLNLFINLQLGKRK